MFWGCMAYGYRGPCFLWEKETKEEKEHYNQMLTTENEAKRWRQEQRRENARIEGTEEYQILQQINANVRRLDQIDPLPSGYPRQKRRPEWEFKERIQERGDRSKGGIDWLLYREHILRPRFYPFIRQIKKETGRAMSAVEDNASAHTTAQVLGEEERKRLGIRSVDWPAQSPDLNKIEPLWNYLKDSLEEYEFKGQSQDTKEQVKAALVQEWEKIPIELINRHCLDLQNKLQLVIQNKGDNNFHG